MGKVITFLHFSDIHFNKNSDSIYCLDQDLRNEMILDVENVIIKEQLQPYGIIVCGDIAYSGQAKEYEIADGFINDLVDKLRIKFEHVFCVPGNHDVDQGVAKKSVSVYAVQKLLENSDDNWFHTYLDKIREEVAETKDDILYRALKNYNDFSGKYMGNVSSQEPPWTHEIELDEGYTLCLYGINSTIISNADDHSNIADNNPRKMRVGNHQIPKRQEKKIYMTICHHPTDNWGEDIVQILDERAMIQLYGHKHVQTLDANNRRIKIGTGALQPDRREPDWQPRYNFLSVNFNAGNIEIMLYPRIWDESIRKFVQEENACDVGQNSKKIILPVEYKIAVKSEVNEEKLNQKVRETSDSKRKLVYKLWGLQIFEREKVMGQFKVFNGIPMDDLNQNIEKILHIAEKNNIIEQIIAKIEKNGGY